MADLKQWRGLVRAQGLGEENPAWTSGLRDPILPAISYFLTLSEVPGFQESTSMYSPFALKLSSIWSNNWA